MVNFKEWNVKHLGNILLLSLVLILIIAMVKVFIMPVLTTLLPTVFVGGVTLTDTLLFLILLRLTLK